MQRSTGRIKNPAAKGRPPHNANPHHNTSINRQKQPDLSAPPPFTLQDLRAAIPEHCWKKDAARSLRYAAFDLLVCVTLAVAAAKLNSWCVVAREVHAAVIG